VGLARKEEANRCERGLGGRKILSKRGDEEGIGVCVQALEISQRSRVEKGEEGPKKEKGGTFQLIIRKREEGAMRRCPTLGAKSPL